MEMKQKLICSHFLLVLISLFLFFISCEDNDNNIVKDVVVEIDSEPGIFHGHPAIKNSSTGVYIVNEPGFYIKEDGNYWQIEPQTYIKGFSYEPGFYYKLCVRLVYQKDVYGGSPIMSLIKILEKKETESVRCI